MNVMVREKNRRDMILLYSVSCNCKEGKELLSIFAKFETNYRVKW